MTERIEIGPCVLYRGDCRDIFPAICDVDAVITDPPYGEDDTHKRHLSGVILKDGTPAGQALGFEGISENEMLCLANQWVASARSWVVFTCEWKFCRTLDDAGILVRHGIWRKPDGAPQFTGDRPGTGWEAVAICHHKGRKRWNGGGKHAFWQYPKGNNTTGHPTGKPVGLFVEFVADFTNKGDLVLDPFMGSGTTGVACIQEGRRFVGIEVDEKFFAIAADRIEKAWRDERSRLPIQLEHTACQMPLFEESDP